MTWFLLGVFFRDISFLYDVPQPSGGTEKPEKFDKSVIRRDAELKTKMVFIYSFIYLLTYLFTYLFWLSVCLLFYLFIYFLIYFC